MNPRKFTNSSVRNGSRAVSLHLEPILRSWVATPALWKFTAPRAAKRVLKTKNFLLLWRNALAYYSVVVKSEDVGLDLGLKSCHMLWMNMSSWKYLVGLKGMNLLYAYALSNKTIRTWLFILGHTWVWPDEFVKKCPKCSPANVLSKLIYKSTVEKLPNNLCFFCN
jgi:hypothetical protein